MPTKRLVLFSSKTCAPCKAMKPELERLQQERGFQLDILVLEDDAKPFQKYQVRSVPTLALMEGEEELARIIGGKSRLELISVISRWLQ
jgi:thioredoxin 1